MSRSMPMPRPTPLSQPFWDAAARQELVLQRCDGCGTHLFYPRHNCGSCGSRALTWVPSSGQGSLFTYTIARRPTHPAFAERVPYVIAVVELDEGPRMTTNLVDCPLEHVSIGMPLEVTFSEPQDGLRLPFFRPRASA